MCISPRNRLLPRYINIAANRYKIETIVGANNTTKPKRNKRRRKTKSNVDKVGSTKTLMIRNRCALRRIPTMILALRSSAIQSNRFKKGCEDDDVAARTNPRVSPGMWEGCGKGEPRRAPQEGMAVPASVTASVSDN
jgi:hypothetical protein